VEPQKEGIGLEIKSGADAKFAVTPNKQKRGTFKRLDRSNDGKKEEKRREKKMGPLEEKCPSTMIENHG
jgi:hypothetical protein